MRKSRGSVVFVTYLVVEISARFEARLGAIVHREVCDFVGVVGALPKGRGTVLAVFIQGVVGELESAKLLFVAIVVSNNAAKSLETSVSRLGAFAHGFHDGMGTADFDVLFTFSG